MAKRRVTPISLKQKLEIITANEANVPKKSICEKYKCDISTVNRILRNKSKIVQTSENSANLQQKRQRKGLYDNVEKALVLWFNQHRQKNCTVNSVMLLNKAKEFAINFGEDFEPDTTWLFRWRKRHNIKFEKIHGTASAAGNQEFASDYLGSVLPELIKEYDPENIMNADESGLFYKALPSSSCYRAGGKPFRHYSQKARLTILFVCNATGSFKRAYTIGKAKHPRCPKYVKTPVPYMSNKNAWMTTKLWSEIMHSLDAEMQKSNRKIILFVKNASCHRSHNLRNIEIHFLPPNRTAFIQPLDQGIIHSFKMYYRQIIVKKHLSALERDMSTSGFYKSVSLLDALSFVKRAWWLVKPETISNCFGKAGFFELPVSDLDVVENNDILEIVVHREEYIGCDNHLECYGDLTEAEIVESVKDNQPLEEEIEVDEEDASNKIPSAKEALNALDILQKYCIYYNIDGSLDQIEDEILKVSLDILKQKTITDYTSLHNNKKFMSDK